MFRVFDRYCNCFVGKFSLQNRETAERWLKIILILRNEVQLHGRKWEKEDFEIVQDTKEN